MEMFWNTEMQLMHIFLSAQREEKEADRKGKKEIETEKEERNR